MAINLKNKKSKKLLECRICNSQDILPILDLGNQPLANSLKKEKTQSETFFSLEICQCKKCSVIQLTETIDAKLLFKEKVEPFLGENIKFIGQINYKIMIRFYAL